jgi:hypothetical protein
MAVTVAVSWYVPTTTPPGTPSRKAAVIVASPLGFDVVEHEATTIATASRARPSAVLAIILDCVGFI